MLETLGAVDQALFLLINVTLANPVTDFLMPIVTSNNVLRISYGLVMVLLLWRGDRKVRWLVLVSLIAIALADQLAAGFLKPLIGRIRPCHVLTEINLLVGCGGGKAMPSAHAANAFAVGILFAGFYRRVRWWLVGLASLIALSRVFVGVHYPGDILVGAAVGTAVAVGLIGIFVTLERKYPIFGPKGADHGV